MRIAALLLFWPLFDGAVSRQENEPSVEQIVQRMEERVAPLKDIQFEYSTRLPLGDPDATGTDWHVRLFHRADAGLRLEAYRPGSTAQKIAPLNVRYVYTADRLLYALTANRVELAEEQIPLAVMQFQIAYADPDFKRIDPFLLPLEYPARLFFDDPLILASVAPRRILSLENKARVVGKRSADGRACWVIESEHSLAELGRLRGTTRFGVAASTRDWFIDSETWQIRRVEFTFIMNRRDDNKPLLVSRAVDWQEAAGVALPKTVEVGYGDRERDGAVHLDRRLAKRVDSLIVNSKLSAERILPAWERDDIYADAVLRKPAFYASRARKDSAANYAWTISSLVSGQAFAGFWGRGRQYLDPDVMKGRLLDAYNNPKLKSTAIRRSLLGLLESEKGGSDCEEFAREMKGPSPPLALWIASRFPQIGVAVNEEGLNEEEGLIAIGIRMARDPKVFEESLKGRGFRSRLTLVQALAEKFDGLAFPGDSPFAAYGAALREDDSAKMAAALKALAASEASEEAAEFVVHRLHRIVESAGDEEFKELASVLSGSLELAGKRREGDPFVCSLKGEIARRLGSKADEAFAKALEKAREVGPDSPYGQAAFHAVSEAAMYFSGIGDEKHVIEAGEIFLRLAASIGRPATEVINDEKRSPVVILANHYVARKKFAELYRAIRIVDWNAYRYFAGVQGALQLAKCLDAFIEAATKECLSGTNLKEYMALARLIDKQMNRPSASLVVLEKARLLEKSNPEATRLYAEVAAHGKQFDLAIAAWRSLMEIDSKETAAARLSIAEIEIGREAFDAARQELEKLEIGRLDGDEAERAGRAFAAVRDPERAIKSYLRAEELERAVNLPLGRLYDLLKNRDEAMRRFNRAIAAGESDSAIRKDPREETDPQKAKRLLYERIGEDYFLKKLFEEKLEPLTDEETKRVRTLVEKVTGEAEDEREDALEGLRSIGRRATALLRKWSEQSDIRELLLEWAEPR